MADSKKISIRLGIDGADGVKDTLNSIGNEGAKSLERIKDTAQSISPALSSLSTSINEVARSIPPNVLLGLDTNAKSAAASARAMEAALANERRTMQTLLDAADPAASALRRIAQAEAEANRALAHGTITQAEHQTIMKSLQSTATGAAKGYSNLSVIAQQAGYQIADVAAVASSGGDAFRAIGVQAGQFLGVLGPMGAVAGAAVTVLGLLATNLLDTGKASDEAKRQADSYASSLKSLTSLQEKYIDAVRESQGLQPLNKDITNLHQQKIDAETALQNLLSKKPTESLSVSEKAAATYEATGRRSTLSGELLDSLTFGYYGADLQDKAYKEITQRLHDQKVKEARDNVNIAVSNLNEGIKTVKDTDAKKAEDAIKGLNTETEKEIRLMQVSVEQRERAKAVMEAETKVREKLKGLGVDDAVVEAQVAKARAQAASAYDQKQREEASQKQSEADDKATAAIEKQIAALKEHAYQLTLSDRELKIHQELLKGYENAGPRGLTLMEEQRITYEAGHDYDTDKAKKDAAKAEEDRMKAQREHMQEMRQFSNQMAASMTSAFEEAIFAGKDLRGVFSGLLDDMAKMILRAAVMKPLMNWVTGGIDSLFSFGSSASAASDVASLEATTFAASHHQGGVVGGAAPQRAVPISAFAHAPRYHSGGIAGLSSDEVPAILQRGEVVLPRRAVQASGGVNITIVQHNTIQASSSSSSAADNSAFLQQVSNQIATATKAMVMQVLVDQKRAGGLLTA